MEATNRERMEDVESALLEVSAAHKALEEASTHKGTSRANKNIAKEPHASELDLESSSDGVEADTTKETTTGETDATCQEAEIEALRDKVAKLQVELEESTGVSSKLQGFLDGVSRVNEELRSGVEAVLAEKEASDKELEKLQEQLKLHEQLSRTEAVKLSIKEASTELDSLAEKSGDPPHVENKSGIATVNNISEISARNKASTSEQAQSETKTKASTPWIETPLESSAKAPDKILVSALTQTEGEFALEEKQCFENVSTPRITPDQGYSSDDEWRERIYSSLAKSTRVSAGTVEFIRKVKSDIAKRNKRLEQSSFRRQLKEETSRANSASRRLQQKYQQQERKHFIQLHNHANGGGSPAVVRKLDFEARGTDEFIRRMRSEAADRASKSSSARKMDKHNYLAETAMQQLDRGPDLIHDDDHIVPPTPIIARRLDFESPPQNIRQANVSIAPGTATTDTVQRLLDNNPAVFGSVHSSSALSSNGDGTELPDPSNTNMTGTSTLAILTQALLDQVARV